jgi:hypothetical protein
VLNEKYEGGNYMYAIEFETDITGKYIELKNYWQVLNKHAKIIVLVDELNECIADAQTVKQLQQFDEIIQRRSNLPQVSEEIDIEALCNGANCDIF